MIRKLTFPPEIHHPLFFKLKKIDQFSGKWMKIENKENRYLKELKEIATIQSIGSSTRIEGATLTNEEVQSLVKNMKITSFKTRDEQEVAGYYNALDLVLESYHHIELNENNIKTLHNQLMKFNAKDLHHKGIYKELPNKVVATYPDGTMKTIFRTTEPFLVEKEMEDLVFWTTNQLQKEMFHPLLVIGGFIYEFLSIHPFQDGNGRLSRILTTLLLMQNGYGFVQYVSFENIIERRKKAYYRALMDGQQHRYSKEEVISEWIVFFVDCLDELIQKLEKKYVSYLEMGGYLNARQSTILEHIREKKIVLISDLEKLVPNVSQRTLSRDLKVLISEFFIERIGKGRAASYKFLKNRP